MKFHEPDITDKEEQYMIKALRSGHTSGRGPFTRKVEVHLEGVLKDSRVLMTTSGTHALEMAVRLSGLSLGDEVIVPSYTFPSTANAVLAVGAKPILVPVEENTLTITAGLISPYISEKTKAVIAVHYGGLCSDLEKIVDLCKSNNLILIEDAAQAYGSVYKGKALGTYGDFGCLSFHGTKNDISGEGGALIIPEKEHEDYRMRIENAEKLLEKGTDRMAFSRGDKSKYEWKGYGSSYVPSDILMALLYGQLESFDKRLEKRRWIIGQYIDALKSFEPYGIGLFKGFQGDYGESELECSRSNAHLFYLVLPTPDQGRAFKKHMDRSSIPVRQHFVPLHMSEMGRKLGYSQGDMPFEAGIFDRLYRLPLHSKLTEEDVKEIIACTVQGIGQVMNVDKSQRKNKDRNRDISKNALQDQAKVLRQEPGRLETGGEDV